MNAPTCTVHGVTEVTLVSIPAGWSEPQETKRLIDGHAAPDVDAGVDAIVSAAWARGDEPLEVRSSRGKVLWTNSRFGDLS